MARLTLAQPARPAVPTIPRFLAPSAIQQQQRYKSVIRIKKQVKKKKPLSKDFRRPKIEKIPNFPRWSLVEAMRVLRAYEVGQLSTVKYELHIHLKTSRNGPVIKSSIRLPNPVQSEWQIAVIAPENTPMATAAAAAGAKAVGEESLFNAIKAGNINFDKLICFEGSEAKLNAARLGPILGPKGLMPSAKTKTIVKDPVKAIFDSTGSVDYKERLGNIRLAVGQIGHSPEQLRSNIEAVVAQIKKECATISEEQPKEVHEIIISSTNSPISFSLNGKFKDEDSKTTPAMVSGVI